MHANLDALLIATYVLIDDFLPKRPPGRGRPQEISDAEVITLTIAQALLQIPDDRRFLATARRRLGHLFPYLPEQPGYCKRVRGLTAEIERAINYLAYISPSFCDGLRLLDSTPVPCAASRQTTRRSELARIGAYGYCRSHSRYFWGFRLYLLCAADGTPIAFELAPANEPERKVAKEMLERVSLAGYTVIADKGFAGEDFEAFMASRGAKVTKCLNRFYSLALPQSAPLFARSGSALYDRCFCPKVSWACGQSRPRRRNGSSRSAAVKPPVLGAPLA
jgi:transposase